MVGIADLREFCVSALVMGGASPSDARTVSEVLIWAERRGRGPQGAIWLDALTARLASDTILSPTAIETVDDRGGLVILDAGGGLGHVAATRAVDLVIERSAQHGIAAVALRNSSHFGPCGYYASLLAGQGRLAIVATNAYPKVAPHGGVTPVLGTNPIGFATPRTDSEPVIGDLSTGAVAGSRIRQALEAGVLFEEEVAVDEFGRASRDPAVLSNGGAMLPVGGPKGTALGLMVEALTSMLSGGATPDRLGSMFNDDAAVATSHFVMGIALPEGAPAHMSAIAGLFDATPSREGMAVRLPGTSRHNHDTDQDAVTLDNDTTAALWSTIDRVGIDVPAWLSGSASLDC